MPERLYIRIPQSVLPTRGGTLSLGSCIESKGSRDVSQGSRLAPKGEIWAPKIRTGDIHCLLKHDHTKRNSRDPRDEAYL